MNSPRYSVLHLALALFHFGVSGYARADDPDAIVTVACDLANPELRIDERFEEAPEDAPYPRVVREGDMEFSMRGLSWATEVAGQVVWEHREVRRTCRLGSDDYVTTFSAYKPNWNVPGECGAGTSTVSITVTRNKATIFKDLVLHESCRSDQEIENVRILSRTREVVAMISRRGSDERKVAKVPITTAPISRNELLAAAVIAAAPNNSLERTRER